MSCLERKVQSRRYEPLRLLWDSPSTIGTYPELGVGRLECGVRGCQSRLRPNRCRV